jgi:hypothetical protein
MNMMEFYPKGPLLKILFINSLQRGKQTLAVRGIIFPRLRLCKNYHLNKTKISIFWILLIFAVMTSSSKGVSFKVRNFYL